MEDYITSGRENVLYGSEAQSRPVAFCFSSSYRWLILLSWKQQSPTSNIQYITDLMQFLLLEKIK